MVSSGLLVSVYDQKGNCIHYWLGKSPEDMFSLAHLESCAQFWTNCRGRGALLWFSWIESLAQPVGNEVQGRHIREPLVGHLGNH